MEPVAVRPYVITTVLRSPLFCDHHCSVKTNNGETVRHAHQSWQWTLKFGASNDVGVEGFL